MLGKEEARQPHHEWDTAIRALEMAEASISRSKVVAPLTNAVSFINHVLSAREFAVVDRYYILLAQTCLDPIHNSNTLASIPAAQRLAAHSPAPFPPFVVPT